MGIIEDDINSLVSNLNENKVSFAGKSVLVTGGGGFLGSWICDILVKQDAQVICLDNFSSGQKRNIQHLMGIKNFKFIEHDISKPIFIMKELIQLCTSQAELHHLNLPNFPSKF